MGTPRSPAIVPATPGTESGGPSEAPASLDAAKEFDGDLCSGPFHLRIKEQEKSFISSPLLPQSRRFSPPHLLPPLLCSWLINNLLLLSSSSGPGLSPLSAPGSFPIYSRAQQPCRQRDAHRLLGASLSRGAGTGRNTRLPVPSVRMSLPRNQQNFSQDKLGEHPQQAGTPARKLASLIPVSEAGFLNDFH